MTYVQPAPQVTYAQPAPVYVYPAAVAAAPFHVYPAARPVYRPYVAPVSLSLHWSNGGHRHPGQGRGHWR